MSLKRLQKGLIMQEWFGGPEMTKAPSQRKSPTLRRNFYEYGAMGPKKKIQIKGGG